MFSASWSLAPDSRLAAAELVRYQRHAANARWGLLFASGFHQPQWLLSELQRLLGHIPLFGGSCCGIITPQGVEYGGYEALLLLFDTPVDYGCFSVHDHSGFARWLADDYAFCLLDLLGQRPEPLLASLNGKQLDGVGLVGDLQMKDSFQFCGDQVVDNQVIALKLPPPTNRTQTLGTSPISPPMTVTEAKGNCIYALDGQPALDRTLAVSGLDALPPGLLRQLAMGFDWGGSSVCHSLRAVDSQQGTLTLGTGQVTVGQTLQLMRRDSDAGRAKTAQILTQCHTDRPSFYIECMGRTAMLTGASEEDATVLAAHLGERLVGILSGAELLSQQGQSKLVNWAGTLLQW
ncbi:FIST N-terminal domain-containing protein [Gallaecimonas sp. GXIMD1310]|uniref:FIST N-terminal domain-containing protein n=1 Tax=Gallaecimonas sp. GXIMD1310 TaxID=3131926 RepID=UPI0032538DF2